MGFRDRDRVLLDAPDPWKGTGINWNGMLIQNGEVGKAWVVCPRESQMDKVATVRVFRIDL